MTVGWKQRSKSWSGMGTDQFPSNNAFGRNWLGSGRNKENLCGFLGAVAGVFPFLGDTTYFVSLS